MIKVLIIDDSYFTRLTIKNMLTTSEKYLVVGEAANANDGIELALELEPDLITMDFVLPDMMGAEAIKELRKEKVNAAILIVSALGQERFIQEGMEAGANDYLVKPFDSVGLLQRVDQLFEKKVETL